MTAYENKQEKGRYLMIEDKGQVPAPYIEGILLRCYIPGLLPVYHACRNEQKLWLYDRRGRQSLSRYLEEHKLQGEDILRFLKCMTECGMSVEEYLLPSDALWLKPELIFKDRAEEWRFLYYPGDCSGIEDLSFLLDALTHYVDDYLMLSDAAEVELMPMDRYAAEARAALNELADLFADMDRCINWEDLNICVLEHRGYVHSIDPTGVHDRVHCPGESINRYSEEDGCRTFYDQTSYDDVDKADRKGRLRRGLRGFLTAILITAAALFVMWFKCYM